MTEEPEKRCDPDDIICGMEELIKMKNLRSAFEDEDFRKEFPSLVELSDKLDETIKERETNIRGKLEACNLPTIEEIKLEEEPEPKIVEEE